MEIFEQRGLLAALGDPPREPLGHYGGVPLDFSVSPTAFPGQWKVPQARVEVLLAERVRELGGEVRREHEVCGVEADGDQVRIEASAPGGSVRLCAGYLVGCDGEDSAVRRLAGFGLRGRAASRQLLRADVLGLDIRDRRFERLPRGLAIASTRSGVTRVMVHAPGLTPVTGQPSFEEVAAAWLEVTGEDISGGRASWLNAFDDDNRQADPYRKGRVLLAGDAAHRQMPVGGQALNFGLQDAVNLGWKLAAEAAGRAAAGLLDTYHAERHAIGRTVLDNIAAQSLLLLGGAETEAFRGLLRELIDLPEVRDRLTGMISGLDIRYGASHDPLVGTRCPDAALQTAFGSGPGLGGALRCGRGALLHLSGDEDHRRRLEAAAAPWAGLVQPVSAKARWGSPLEGRDALLVRPDGYVAWSGGLRDDPSAALREWFGVLRPAARGRAGGRGTRSA
jgi:2-polyprenyl-6-methoxyphenol hydroxylase-like FAD-dependent oxidoreductase